MLALVSAIAAEPVSLEITRGPDELTIVMLLTEQLPESIETTLSSVLRHQPCNRVRAHRLLRGHNPLENMAFVQVDAFGAPRSQPTEAEVPS